MNNDEIATALTDLVTVIQEGRTGLDEISSSLVDLLAILRQKEKPPPVNVTVQPAPVSVNPQTINVSPTPVNITPAAINVQPSPVHIQPSPVYDCEITHEWEGERIVRSHVRRIKPKG